MGVSGTHLPCHPATSGWVARYGQDKDGWAGDQQLPAGAAGTAGVGGSAACSLSGPHRPRGRALHPPRAGGWEGEERAAPCGRAGRGWCSRRCILTFVPIALTSERRGGWGRVHTSPPLSLMCGGLGRRLPLGVGGAADGPAPRGRPQTCAAWVDGLPLGRVGGGGSAPSPAGSPTRFFSWEVESSPPPTVMGTTGRGGGGVADGDDCGYPVGT